MKNKNTRLLEYLYSLINENRKTLFQNKIIHRTKYISIALENVYQNRNISAAIRSADCFGIQDIHIINRNVFQDNNQVSLGAEKWINTFNYKDSHQAIEVLKKNGYKIIVTTPHDAKVNLFELDLNLGKQVLFFGSEIEGCSNYLLDNADTTVNIPSYGFTESFNISVAVSLCLQHITYKLRQSNIDWELSMEEKTEVLLYWLRKSIKSSDKIEDRFLRDYKLR